MTAFDPTKPVQTRDGREAGIYRSDVPSEHCIHGWAKDGSGCVFVTSWDILGRCDRYSECGGDLVNVPVPPRRWWVLPRSDACTSLAYLSGYQSMGCVEVIELTPAVREALQEKGLLT